MASTPIFTTAVRVGVGQVSAANTNRDGTGTVVTIFNAGTNGSRIEHIDIVSQGTVTAGVVRLFIHDGTNYRLFFEQLVTATTPTTALAVWSVRLSFASLANVLVLPTGYSIRASTNNAETFNIHVFGGDY